MSETYEHLIGHRFPGGTYTLADYEAWLWADAVTAPTGGTSVDPSIAYMIGLHGGGLSIADIMALLGADADSGVLFGEVELTFARPLQSSTTYVVQGSILAVERKQGRRAGTFDRVTFEHTIADQDGGAPVASVRHVWIFPRQEA
jgi:hypothetical protein